MELVENIRKACAERKMEVTELERAAGLPRNSIYKWDKHIPSVDRVKKVAAVLQVTVDELISRR